MFGRRETWKRSMCDEEESLSIRQAIYACRLQFPTTNRSTVELGEPNDPHRLAYKSSLNKYSSATPIICNSVLIDAMRYYDTRAHPTHEL